LHANQELFSAGRMWSRGSRLEAMSIKSPPGRGRSWRLRGGYS